MKWALLCIFLLAPGILFAQSFPALYSVASPEPGDLVSVRIAPDPSAEIVTSLMSATRDIEVIALDDSGEWGWVNTGEGSGWAAMSDLERQFSPGNTLLPRPLMCFGSVPFWKLDIGSGPEVELGLPEETPRRYFGLWMISSTNRADHYALMADNRTGQMNAIVKRTVCVDDATDRIFGLEIDLLIRSDKQTSFYSGCCTLTPEMN